MSRQPKGQPKGAKEEKAVASSVAGEDIASWCNREEINLMRNALLFTDKMLLFQIY